MCSLPTTTPILAIYLHPATAKSPRPDAATLLAALQAANQRTGSAIARSVNALIAVGFVRPATLLVTAVDELHVEVLKGAWAQRRLLPPWGYGIECIGT